MTKSVIPIARPLLGAEEEAAVVRVLRSGWLMQGPEVEAFEGELGTFLDARHVCAVSSGTAALHLALLAAGVGPGDEVVTASHSFIATANAIRLCGAVPVFVDIEPQSYNLDVGLVEAALSPRTRAVLAVHQLGMPCDLLALLALCERHRVQLVEDAACAIGSELRVGEAWQRIGRPHGGIACFSFHPRKLLTTGEGGAIVTRDPQIDARVRRLRQHGSDPRGVFIEAAPNYRMTDLQAAVGRVQLERLPALLVERRAQVERYRVMLSPLGVEVSVEPTGRMSNWQSLCVRLPVTADTAAVVGALAKQEIHARRGVSNAHEQPAYATPGSYRIAGTLVESERAWRETICLPLYPGLGAENQERVVAVLADCLNRV